MAADPDSSTPLELTIIIPTLNEAGNIGPLIARCRATIAPLGVSAEVVVVDGGSRDGTVAEAQQAGGRVIAQQGRGYGGALRTGVHAARGQHIQTLDSDLSHEPEVIASLWGARDRADIVTASRYVPGLGEILILIFNAGGTITEVPFQYRPRQAGKSHAKLFKFGLAYSRTFYAMWKLRRQRA